MIKAIIFDCFGVLASDGLLPFRKQFFGHSPELMQQASDLSKQVDAGLAGYDDMIRELAQMAGLEELSVRRQIESNLPDEDLFAYIKQALKPHYKIGMLSNAGANWLNEIFRPDQVALFDAVTLTYEIGHVKPAAEAYQTIARKLGVEPEACIMVDDQPRYVMGAQDVGMQAVQYVSFEQFKTDLEDLLPAK